MTKYNTISGKEANERNLIPITRGYSDFEHEMLDRAIATLGTKTYTLVNTSEGIVIARPKNQVNLLKNEH